MGWLAGYDYRKPIPITGEAGAGADYQVKLEVHPGAGSDGNGVVYLNSHGANFPNDIRFTDNDGTTELDHWLEEVGDDGEAVFWIEVADDLGSNQSFYIYYGKGGGASGSDGDDTFLFFDDFEDAALDPAKWDVLQGDLELEDCLIPAGNIEAFCRPVAEYHSGTHNRTYFVYLNTNKEVQIRYYDHDGDYVSSPVTLHTYGSLDNHGAPAVLVLPDGKILVFYALHDSPLYCRRSTNAEDISAWDAPVTIDGGDCTYPQPILLSGGDVWIFYRYAVASDHRTICYKVSADDGGTWGGRTTLVDFGAGWWLYPQTIQGGDTIHVAWTKRSDPGGVSENIYYIYSPDDGVTWKKRDGTTKTPPIDEAEADLVYDTGVGEQSIVVDIKLDGSNDPFIAFIDDYASDPGDGRFAFYDSGWETHFVCAIEKTSYDSAGLCIDYNDVFTIYAGVLDAGKAEIQKWISPDQGDNWNFSESITDESNYDHHAPMSVKGYQSEFKLLWKTLRHWTSSSDWDWFIMADPNGMTRSLELKSTMGARGAIQGKTSFAYPAVLAGIAVASVPLVDSTYFLRMRKAGDNNEYAGSFAQISNADQVRFRTYRGGVVETTDNIVVSEMASWTRYSVRWNSQDDAKAYMDGVLKATHATRVSGQDQVALIGVEGVLGVGVWLLGWVFARNYYDPEPVVGTAGAEEAREGLIRVPRPPAYGLDPMIF